MSDESKPNAQGDGVHRLVDMVVEEVSLVDRAANKHRFLVVKRDAPMNTPKQPETDDEEQDGEDTPPKGKKKKPATRKAEASAVVTAASAVLERLTEAVEALGEASDAEATELCAELCEELSEAASALAELAGVDAPSDEANKSVSVGETVAKVRELLAGVTSMLSLAKEEAPTEPAPPPAPAAGPAPEARVTEQLEAVASSLRTLTDAVKEQGQRLGRLEKGVALPNSRSAPERAEKRADQDVGWPLDLNRPLDRDSVDKSLSFHDR